MDDETKEKNSRSRSDAYAQARKASEIGTYWLWRFSAKNWNNSSSKLLQLDIKIIKH
jgi:hypothetical protein